MVYVPAAPERGRRTLVWVDREGREDPIAAPPRPYIYPRVSPDGGRVAVEVWDESRDIWIWDLMRETLTRITDNPGRDGFPVWTPDSRRVIFGSARNASTNLFWRSADGIGPVDRLTDSQRIQFPYSVSPDGSQLVIREDDPETGLDVSMVSLTAERRTNPLMRTAFNEQNAEVSPDGRWLVYQSNESGQDEIYVRPFPAVGEGRWQISTTGGTRPLWARSGRELFYLAPGGLSSVIISPETAFKAGPPTVLIGRRYFAESAFIGRTYDISPDGRRFLMIKESNAAGRPQIVIVQNWTEALKRFFTRAEQIR
jgi:serine/threonine-protein kinase